MRIRREGAKQTLMKGSRNSQADTDKAIASKIIPKKNLQEGLSWSLDSSLYTKSVCDYSNAVKYSQLPQTVLCCSPYSYYAILQLLSSLKIPHPIQQAELATNSRPAFVLQLPAIALFLSAWLFLLPVAASCTLKVCLVFSAACHWQSRSLLDRQLLWASIRVPDIVYRICV